MFLLSPWCQKKVCFALPSSYYSHYRAVSYAMLFVLLYLGNMIKNELICMTEVAEDNIMVEQQCLTNVLVHIIKK